MKIKKIILLVAVMVFAFVGNTQTIDTKKSIVNFKVPKAEGTFVGMTGEITLDLNDLSNAKFNVSIDPSTINTGSKKRDEHLKTEDFFYVEMFPKITFKSTSVSKTENGYLTEGTITLHGVTQKVKIIFTIKETESGMTLTGDLSINQADYKMSKKEKMVDIEIICVIKK